MTKLKRRAKFALDSERNRKLRRISSSDLGQHDLLMQQVTYHDDLTPQGVRDIVDAWRRPR